MSSNRTSTTGAACWFGEVRGVGVIGGGGGLFQPLAGARFRFRGRLERAAFCAGVGSFTNGPAVPHVAVERRVGGTVEERVERVILLLRDRVELVVVADGAAGGEAEPRLHRRAGAIDGVAIHPLLGDRSAFAGRDVAAVEAGRGQLIVRWHRQQIAGELLDREAVVRQVLVECLDHPVAILPHLAFVVEVQAVRVGVAGQIEPVAGHLLAKARRLAR